MRPVRIARLLSAVATVALSVSLLGSVGTSAAASPESDAPEPPAGTLLDLGATESSSTSVYDWGNWAHPDVADLYVTHSGTLGVVTRQQHDMVVTTYQPSSLKTVGKPHKINLASWPLWGGFYAAPDGYFYVLVGRDNLNEQDNRNVVAVRRYDASWSLVGTAYVPGGASQGVKGIYQPFDAGSADMVLAGNRLVVHMSRLMYEEEGLHHQVNLTFEVDTDTMVATTFEDASKEYGGYSYSGHSFNQFVTVRGSDLIFVDHGDAYPRAIQMGVMANYPAERAVKTYPLLKFGGGTGDNYTGAAVTDLINGPSGTVVVGNSIRDPQHQDSSNTERSGPRDVFAISADPSTGKHKMSWLTNLQSSPDSIVRGPRVAQIGADRFAVLFGVDTGTDEDRQSRTEYRLMDSAGSVLASRTFHHVAYTAISAPVQRDDAIYWVGTNLGWGNRHLYLQALDLSDQARPELIASWCPPAPFPDIAASNLHCGNIGWLMTTGITKPADGNYHPTDAVTRGSMAAFLFRLTHPGKASPKCTGKPFPDVKMSNVFCGYIQWAAKDGVTQGYPDGTYKPNNGVTRGAMAAFLQRIAVGHSAPKCTDKPFDDVAVGSMFCKPITWAKDNHITFGVGDGSKYGTTQIVNRQSMASFLHRIYNYMR